MVQRERWASWELREPLEILDCLGHPDLLVREVTWVRADLGESMAGPESKGFVESPVCRAHPGT